MGGVLLTHRALGEGLLCAYHLIIALLNSSLCFNNCLRSTLAALVETATVAPDKGKLTAQCKDLPMSDSAVFQFHSKEHNSMFYFSYWRHLLLQLLSMAQEASLQTLSTIWVFSCSSAILGILRRLANLIGKFNRST